jgi:glutamate-5-semialdehyde dehydrogenase
VSFQNLPRDIQDKITHLKMAARKHRQAKTEDKNIALKALADQLISAQQRILSANDADMKALPESATSAFRDRLMLDTKRIDAMAKSLRQVATLPDPVNEVVENRTLENGLFVERVRAPLGLIFMIFESRPNVITEAFSLAFKSGNVILLRGGSESKQTAEVIYSLMDSVLKENGFAEAPFCGIENYDRKIVENLLRCNEHIDVVVPRGGNALIEFVQKTSLIPIIKNDRGLCHAYVDEACDMNMATRIVDNAKTQRPGVCNSLETVLVHEKIAAEFIPLLYQATAKKYLVWHVDAPTKKILAGQERVELAKESNWDTEYLDLIMNCRVVQSFEQALDHIAKHGSKHSEAIITTNKALAKKFISEVDAAAVYWNASTRFTDGYEFGLGGELGISTQKLHVRGPVGLRELTSLRWIIVGSGQIRS